MFKLNFDPAMAAAAIAFAALSSAADAAAPCQVVAGTVANVAPGPFLPSTETVTLQASDKAEFHWDNNDKEAIGWMRITTAEGRELGWVPAGDGAVRCGKVD